MPESTIQPIAALVGEFYQGLLEQHIPSRVSEELLTAWFTSQLRQAEEYTARSLLEELQQLKQELLGLLVALTEEEVPPQGHPSSYGVN